MINAFVALLLSSPAFANQTWAFKTIDPKSFPETKEQMSLGNLPRVRSQDSFGICYGFTTATVAQYYHCKVNKVPNCSELPPSKEISPVAASAFGHVKDGEAWGTGPAHKALKLVNVPGKSTSGLYALGKFQFAYAESCYPFDPIANKYGSDEGRVNQLIDRLQSLYKKSKTEASTCVDCLVDALNKDLHARVNANDIKLALGKDSFEEFLYASIFEKRSNECDDIIELDKNIPETMAFPTQDGASYEAFMSTVKDVLRSGFPLSLGGICSLSDGENCVSGTHAVVITGYRKQCTKAGVCREVLRVQNSWGEEWQRQNDDGWVDARSLIGNKPIGTGVLAWWKPSSPIK